MKANERIGQRYGRLTVIGIGDPKYTVGGHKEATAICQCDCGNIVTVRIQAIASGNTTSCGCFRHERMVQHNSTHGLSKHKLYRVWSAMKDRCDRPGCAAYVNYGNRGIRVCDDWANNFDVFYAWAMANGYQDGLTVDRIDNNRGYEPENCRFITRATQNRNRRYCHVITYGGETKTLSEWSRIYRFDRECFRNQVAKGKSEAEVLADIISRKSRTKQ